jgi:hypothetical protein
MSFKQIRHEGPRTLDGDDLHVREARVERLLTKFVRVMEEGGREVGAVWSGSVLAIPNVPFGDRSEPGIEKRLFVNSTN